ncbi:TetR/AcrR family transcriptional regulator [Streptomyces flavotricini]|uniref:TetR/AcrR family transcriptional regulator helix-turn-helix transcriptional regulator n=1 Tax=Streptomyces flavotricini TaxID=66888 RepID=A0ABS8EHA6_9ACTN|nr:TetR/AcrR family transcriptional regulator [Streptomyces flavotricini]MCC0100213.1 TetR/AcrR family transcriptional regulator; helix-turn-helix transcriptional regulator [Streptomyces flavotricini]
MTHDDSGLRSVSAMPLELLHTPPPKERADAARNRAAVLEAAARLFAEQGVEAVSMDQVAAAAGVGKGTLFRRFGDKSGLAAALLDARERVLQEAILHGPPPLGPGAPADERLAAFLNAYLDYLLEHLALVRMSETATPGARYRIGAYRFWHRHVAILLATAPDPDHTAHALLAALAADHVAALLPEIGEQRMRSGLLRLAHRAT